MDYACLQRAMPFSLGLSAARYALQPWYDVLRSTFLAEEGAAVLAGPSPLPYSRVY